MKNILEYCPGTSVLHKMNPIAKIVLAFLISVSAFAADSIPYLLFVLAADILLGVIGGITNKTMRVLIGLLKFSVFLFILQLLFSRGGNRVFLFITDEGIITAVTICLRLVAACVPLALMLTITEYNDLTNALVRVTRLPYKYAFTIATTIRFIPLFLEEMAAIMEAQTARGVELDAGGFFKKMKLVLPLAVPLLMISVRKIDSTAIAAEARGFHLRTRNSGYKLYPFHVRDFVALLIGAVLMTGGILC